MKKITAIFSFLVFASLSALAAESKILTLEGTIRSFDKETVRITTEKGIVGVPRNLIPPNVKLRANDEVKLSLTEEQFKALK